MISKAELHFLSELEKNNNRDWFTENKKRFETHQKAVKVFFQEVNDEFGKQDSIEKMQIHRIYRDIRFSKDKTPYKINFSVSFDRTKPHLRGGYYLHIQPGGSFVGGGFWEPNAEDLNRIRKEFEMDDEEIRAIIADPSFKKYFGELKGEELKTAPKGFDKTHPAIDLIRKKQYLISRSFTDKEVTSENFKSEVLATFKAMRPFFDYMSEVLGTNLNGESLY
ncbi:hypothetical protein FSS13T_17320 [Flavobacterium saliperosum S13]|uniref:TIGR02453 family protein n=2 Tax=Flavobacterium saliperosum TaxID=329186 RepID=A0A1G4VIY4_9FLAO|nr:DUF2461 domain-containing protein [Flavobacterium saliperosum]ESU25496.1 hypothetical protein FSS13T_17320 [Flavobacterium saliperosum S13]SCX07464.1 TIGR02453 family protein [Flavobacterium saliperosum]